jgi:hypothetical protein
MRTATEMVILLVPLLLLLYTATAGGVAGYEATITGVVRGWASGSGWPEFMFLVLVVALYAHLFRGWL